SARAGERRRIEPLGGRGIRRRTVADNIGMLRAIITRAGAGWIAAAEVGSLVRSALDQEDVAEPPAAEQRIREPAPIRHKPAPSAVVFESEPLPITSGCCGR